MTLTELTEILTDCYPDAIASQHINAMSRLSSHLIIANGPRRVLGLPEWSTGARNAIDTGAIKIDPQRKIQSIKAVRDFVISNYGYPALVDCKNFVEAYLDEPIPF